jgi:cell division protein FtsB
MNKIMYVILITMMCCVSVVFAQQRYKSVDTPQTKDVQSIEQLADSTQKQISKLRTKVADLEARIRKLEQHIAIGSGGNVTITATQLNIQASAQMEIRSAAAMDIKSTLLRLNGGGKPVARLGDMTVGQDPQGDPVITRINVGSATVFVP